MKHSQKSHSSAGSHNMTVMLFTLLGVLIFGSLSLSLKAQTRKFDERVTQTTVGGRNGKIAFTSSHDGNFEIYTMEANGSNQTRITTRNTSIAYLDHHDRRLTFRIVCCQSFTRYTDQGCIHDFSDATDKRLTLTLAAKATGFPSGTPIP